MLEITLAAFVVIGVFIIMCSFRNKRPEDAYPRTSVALFKVNHYRHPSTLDMRYGRRETDFVGQDADNLASWHMR